MQHHLDSCVTGPQPDYGPNRYAAFVIDPDGYRIEVVTKVAQQLS